MRQYDLILDYLEKHGSISTMEAFNLGITRLSTRISELAKSGYTFKKEWVTSKNKQGHVVSFIKYSLDNGEKNE